MKPISTNPKLPYPVGARDVSQLANYDQELVKWLYTYFSNLALRVNETLAKDGSEPMKGALDMGGFDINNVGNFSTSGVFMAGSIETTGPITADGPITTEGPVTAPEVVITEAAGTFRRLRFQSAGLDRWAVQTGTAPETGGNAGSNFSIIRHDDAGVAIDTPLDINRATGALNLAAPPTIAGVPQWETIFDENIVNGVNRIITWPHKRYKTIELDLSLTTVNSTWFYLRHLVNGLSHNVDNAYSMQLVNWNNSAGGAASGGYGRSYWPLGRDEPLMAGHPFGVSCKVTIRGYQKDYLTGRLDYSSYNTGSIVWHGFQDSWIGTIPNVNGLIVGTVDGSATMSGTMIVRGHR